MGLHVRFTETANRFEIFIALLEFRERAFHDRFAGADNGLLRNESVIGAVANKHRNVQLVDHIGVFFDQQVKHHDTLGMKRRYGFFHNIGRQQRMDKIHNDADFIQRVKRNDALHRVRHKDGIDVAGLQTKLNAKICRKRVHVADDPRVGEKLSKVLLTIILAVFLCASFVVIVATHVPGFNHSKHIPFCFENRIQIQNNVTTFTLHLFYALFWKKTSFCL